MDQTFFCNNNLIIVQSANELMTQLDKTNVWYLWWRCLHTKQNIPVTLILHFAVLNFLAHHYTTFISRDHTKLLIITLIQNCTELQNQHCILYLV